MAVALGSLSLNNRTHSLLAVEQSVCEGGLRWHEFEVDATACPHTQINEKSNSFGLTIRFRIFKTALRLEQ